MDNYELTFINGNWVAVNVADIEANSLEEAKALALTHINKDYVYVLYLITQHVGYRMEEQKAWWRGTAELPNARASNDEWDKWRKGE